MKRLTEIVCILDRSGSMDAIRDDAIGGFNSFLDSQQTLPGQARLTLILFDHEYLVVHSAQPIQQVVPLNADTYVPRGATALMDAIGITLEEIGNRLRRTPEHERAEKVIVAILTDGLENASQRYSREIVFDMINRQRVVYSWEFIYLAANQDAIRTGGMIGIKATDAFTFAATADGVRDAWQSASRSVAECRQR
jgi:uncharacterized protein YegL